MSKFSDGTQVFGIGASPVVINSISYIAEDIKITEPATVTEIKDTDGAPLGKTIVPQAKKITAKLQLASGSTAIPTVGLTTSAILTVVYYVTEVGQSYTQGGYAYVDVSLEQKIN